MLSKPHAGRSQADGDTLQELLTKGVLPMTVFRTDDLDATFEKVRRHPAARGHVARRCFPAAAVRYPGGYPGFRLLARRCCAQQDPTAGGALDRAAGGAAG